MTSRDPEPDTTSKSSESRRGLELKPSQVLAGALAAVTAAFLGSFLGTAGTVVGAAVFSVVSTAGTALYQRSLEVSRERAQELARRARVAKPGGGNRSSRADRERTVQLPSLGGEATVPIAVPAAADNRRRRIRLLRLGTAVLAGSAAAFVLGMLMVTGIETATGQALGARESGTTVGTLLRSNSQPEDPRPAPAPGVTPSESRETTTDQAPAPPPPSSAPEGGESGPSASQSRTTTPQRTAPRTTAQQPTAEAPPPPAEPAPQEPAPQEQAPQEQAPQGDTGMRQQDQPVQ